MNHGLLPKCLSQAREQGLQPEALPQISYSRTVTSNSPSNSPSSRCRTSGAVPSRRLGARKQKFPPIAPDFMLELRSRTDSLATLQAKLQEYMASGVRLGWLINPQDQQVEIYRQGQAKEALLNPGMNPELSCCWPGRARGATK